MSTPFAEQVALAMEEMRSELAKAEALQQELNELTASATTKDRSVTVKVGPQGQVLSITFHTEAYRSMAPAELGKQLTDLLNQARATVGEQVSQRIGAFDDLGETLRLSMTGGTELDEILAPLYAMRPGQDQADRQRRSGRQEEFDG
ncbi:YbaB/EbfC family nucleoid-associated protein [Kitasatospora sp. NPDC088391]|uniref:YbaB/EbfC family nucleoid-associated protein n=1 Tax=Kitasatospora sp. NPDC088391 TaxID=3364074 RepID=UPI003807090E